LKIARYLKYDFKNNLKDGMGKLRSFNETEIRKNKIDRKKMINSISSLNTLEEFKILLK
jgi:hypothetical protein